MNIAYVSNHITEMWTVKNKMRVVAEFFNT